MNASISMTANIAAATNSGHAMSKSRIDALADAALARDEDAVPPPTTKKLSPSLLAAAEAAHRADGHLAPPAAKDPGGSSLSLASLPSSMASRSSASLPGEAHSLYLAALLDEQRRRSLLMEPPATLGLGGPLPLNGYAALHGPAKADASLPAPSRRRKPNFAEKLHAVLCAKDCQDAVGWLPSGRAFCIKNQEEFVNRILPKHFREAKFESFARRLKRWGFRKVYQTGLSKTIFGHELFHRDRPELCLVMNGRQKVAASDCKHGQLVDDREAAAAAAGPIAPQQGPSYLDAVPFRPQLPSQLALGPLPFSMHPPRLPASFAPSFPTPFHRPFVSDGTGLDAAAILRDAQAIAARSLPGPHEDPARTLVAARAQLTRLNDDIANCEEQLAILHQLRDLKERRRMLGNATAEGSSRGASPEV